MPRIEFLPVNLPQKASDHRRWGNVSEGFLPYLVASTLQEHSGLVVLIAESMSQAYSVEEAVKAYTSEAIDVMTFPDWETLPYDTFSPHEDIISQRLQTLYRLPRTKRGLIIIPVTTLLHRMAPKSFLESSSLLIAVGDQLDLNQQSQTLVAHGYRAVDTVYEHGEFAIRGSIIDLYPMGSDLPYRIDLFDTEVESIRTFDPESQRTIQKIDRIQLLPAMEMPWDKNARNEFSLRWAEQFPGILKESSVYDDIRCGVKAPGIEYYLPLFFEQTGTIFDYIPSQALILTPASLETVCQKFLLDVGNRYESRRHDRLRPILPPDTLFLRLEELFSHLKHFPRNSYSSEAQNEAAHHQNFEHNQLPNVAVNARAQNPLTQLNGFVAQQSPYTLICAESNGRREAILDLLKRHATPCTLHESFADWAEKPSSLGLVVAPISEGFIDPGKQFAIIAESQLFGERIEQRRRRKKATDNTENLIRDLTELQIGAPVVHLDHGIGRYRGLETLEVENQKNEFLTLEYANEAKLYVPVSNLHLISRYSGSDTLTAPLHKLGTDKWSQSKQKALEKIRDTAAELLDVYARREARKGFAFDKPDLAYEAFCAAFPFEETPDQLAAIDAVMKDMMSPKPMDRLVCGDVGFGKTEVAMRAAYLCATSGKQVAVLVPTTLLAQQHFESFSDRFADTPIKVDVMSRFRSSKQQSESLKALSEGKTDIIVGTHKLIQSDIKFRDLGLLIIDEEHRFGVQQKEMLKSFKAEVDILNLTATPIPRTLNMAMGGMRDFSIIATPPARRLSVKTFVRQKDDALLKEAILRELLRGGQVYYLHNEVKTIDKAAQQISALVDEARVGIAHGQMRERELEQVMSDFYHKRFNVLVCSTIIETGIDIPSANTIIIDRADKFGLAQLHQLRGRVGRSHHQAYAYLLTPDSKNITPDAEKRLEAIAAAQTLGAGFMLATHDLEIRGAGELLGEEQSGQIHNIGFSLYMELLEQAVNAIKQGKTPNLETPLNHGSEINLRIPAIIPDDYLPDVHTRLIFYKRIANAKNEDTLRELKVEMIDRFGLLPEALSNLFRQTSLKLTAQSMGIEKIDAGSGYGLIQFSSQPQVDPLTIVQMVQKEPMRYRLEGATKFKFELKENNADGRLQHVHQLLERLRN